MANVVVEPTKDGQLQIELADKAEPIGPFATQAATLVLD